MSNSVYYKGEIVVSRDGNEEALIQARRKIVAHRDCGDLAAQVRTLDDSLQSFAEVSVEECA